MKMKRRNEEKSIVRILSVTAILIILNIICIAEFIGLIEYGFVTALLIVIIVWSIIIVEYA